ncbi:MAG: hypothetical protein ACOYVH_07380 [Spirochaetota bacterium]
MREQWFALSMLTVILLFSATFMARSQTAARSLEFAGMSWSLRQTAGPSAPGPTTFSKAPDQIWLDESGRLHLRVALRNGVWTGAEAAARRDTGYGTYRFDMDAACRRMQGAHYGAVRKYGFGIRYALPAGPELHNRARYAGEVGIR